MDENNKNNIIDIINNIKNINLNKDTNNINVDNNQEKNENKIPNNLININNNNNLIKNNNQSNQQPKLGINNLKNKLKLKNKNFHINIKNNNNPSEQPQNKNVILGQKYNKINESQISYDTVSNLNLKFNENQNNNHEHKKKFKLSLYNLQKLYLLGAGSSGEVHLVQDKETKKKLALKSVKYNEEVKKQIENEVRLSSLLKHENIIRCYATYFIDDSINFVMEFMNRGTLGDLIKKEKTIPENILGIIIYQLIKGLAYIQKEKIIHRDLKPSNILLNSKGYVKISDFGVSAIIENSWQNKKTMIGTYLYMAPERIDANVYYLNCDVWSIGIIVEECILGYYPYLKYTNFEPIDNVWKVRDLIDKYSPTLDEKKNSKEICDFVKVCLIKDTKQRPTASILIQHPFIKKYENCDYMELANHLSKYY